MTDGLTDGPTEGYTDVRQCQFKACRRIAANLLHMASYVTILVAAASVSPAVDGRGDVSLVL